MFSELREANEINRQESRLGAGLMSLILKLKTRESSEDTE